MVASSRFIAGDPMKPGDEHVDRLLVEHLRGVELKDVPVLHDRDPLPERHRFHLVVRHVHGCHGELLMKLRQ